MKIKWVLVISCLFLSGAKALAQDFSLTILHTNDLHSHFWGDGPDARFTKELDQDPVLGHYARLAKMIQEEQNGITPVLTVDAGDWFGGTIFHALGPRPDNSVAPELAFFAKANYDMIILGNHEFDAGEKGLATMLSKYQKSDYPTSPFKIVVSNNRQWGDDLKPFAEQGLITTSLIKTLQLNGKEFKVGLIGALGPDAALVSATRRKKCTFFGFDEEKVKVEMDLLVLALREDAKKLKAQGAEALVLVIHAGTPEDEEIAKAMPELDAIIAGHTHQLYTQPKIVGKTIIAQAGDHGKFLGVLPLVWKGDRFELIQRPSFHRAIDDTIAPTEDILTWINSLWPMLDKSCERYGAKCRDVIYRLRATYSKNEGPTPMGALITGILRQELELASGKPVDLYFTSVALFRGGLLADPRKTETPQWFSDIFRVFPLGIDENTLDLGYRTVVINLPKREVKLLITFLEIYRFISKNFTPAFSEDIKYKFKWWGVPMVNQLGDLTWRGRPFEDWPENLAVATNEFVASYLDKVGKLSYGLVEFNPLDNSGAPTQKPVFTGPPEFELLMKGLKTKALLP